MYDVMKKVVFVLLMAFCSVPAFSQASLHRKADRSFKNFEFAVAAEEYEKILKNNPNDRLAKVKLEQCYRYLIFIAMEDDKNANRGHNAPEILMPIETR